MVLHSYCPRRRLLIRALLVSTAMALTGMVSLPVPGVAPAQAEQAVDPAAAQIRNFYDALLAAMKTGGTSKARFEKLKPAVEKAFDLEAMTALAIGPTFATMPDATKKALVDAFTRMTVANYAKNFDSFNGEKFTVEPHDIVRGSTHFVKSALVPVDGNPIAFNYRMQQVDNTWKIVDVYLAGNISQMAQKRSDFSSTLRSGGPMVLAKRINAVADRDLE